MIVHRIHWIGPRHAAIALMLAGGACKRESEPTPPELARPAILQSAPPVFNPIHGDTIREAVLLRQPLPLLRSRLEIRTVLVRGGVPASFLATSEGVMEVRSGSVWTVIGGTRQQRQRGEMWTVPKGARVTLEGSGQVAVLRAIYLVAGEK